MTTVRLIFVFSCSFMLSGAAFSDEASSSLESELLFAKQVLPLLENKCFGCHGGADKTEGGLDLTTLDGHLTGGDSGPALIRGKAPQSAVFLATSREPEEYSAMPPQERNALSAAERELIARWVDTGAQWPNAERIFQLLKSESEKSGSTGDMIVVETSGGLSSTWENREYAAEDVWAYQPIENPPVPWGSLPNEAKEHPVDAFLHRKLKQAEVDGYAPPADPRTLMRRATLGLTGLPPEQPALDAAVKDGWNFEETVDELLESPHYGEHLARLWLDVVRYADTGGFANDYERPNAWRYRDYVVRSFNADKPINEFIKEQIAGDELDENNPENLIAVGFLRSGPWEHTSMSVAKVTRQQFLDDVTHSVGVTFLGQGLRCCKCHDHKFDPLPTKDYYRMQANFAPVQFADRKVPYLPEENTDAFKERKELTEKLLAHTKQEIAKLRAKSNAALKVWLKERGLKSVKDLPKDERPASGRIGLTDLEQSVAKIYNKRKAYFERELKRYEPYAFSVYSGKPRTASSTRVYNKMPADKDRNGPAEPIHILTGGSIESPSELVGPGVVSAMSGSNDVATPTDWNTIPDGTKGRRLALAEWIASDRNTLTARVFVNRIWQRHFGTGLVATPNNFGKTGAKPTHPELLDYLARWFMNHGWSAKKLDRFIMSSAAYQQSGIRPNLAVIVDKDSANQWLSRFPVRRLTAEEIRDSLLAVTGELNREIGGLGVFPKINWEVAAQPRHIMGSVAPAYTPSVTPAERNRRSLYAFRYRTLADPFMEVFNQPVSETSCERRDETTVATQAFALFNSEFTQDRAVALADAIAAKADELDQQVDKVFQMILGRTPTADEAGLAKQHVEELRSVHASVEVAERELPETVKRGMVEELTGALFEWDEPLIGLEGYQPDKSMADLGANARALAELCLVLMNSNEFVYVR